MSYTIKSNDTRRPIIETLKNHDGTPVDLTGCKVAFMMAKYKKLLINREAEIIDELNGKVRFRFVDGETSEVGMMEAEFEVEYPDGTFETFPNDKYILINITSDLGRGITGPSMNIDGGDFLTAVYASTVDGGTFEDENGELTDGGTY